jgi:hypothetical protein
MFDDCALTFNQLAISGRLWLVCANARIDRYKIDIGKYMF